MEIESMEVTVEVQIDAKSYFDFICSTIMNDLEETEYKEIKKGISYEKAMTTGFMKSEMCKVKITEYEYPHIVEMHYISKKSTNILRYVLQPINSTSCKVTYRETKYDANHQAMTYSGMFEKSYKKKIKKRMRAVADYLNQNKAVEE